MFYYIMFCIWYASVSTISLMFYEEQWAKDEINEIFSSHPMYDDPKVRKVILTIAMIVQWIAWAIGAPYYALRDLVTIVRSR